MIDWYKAGSEEPDIPPDLFGTIQLPLPSMCFGPSVAQYNESIRNSLVSILKNEKAQVMPWPQKLKDCFNLTMILPSKSQQYPLMGSPMLDVSLGQVGALHNVLKDIGASTRRKSHSPDDHQLDDILPPEVPTAWVQCEKCHKWRRVAWHVDSDALPDEWECHMNFWDPENSTCSAPQDYYDPDLENTIQTTSGQNVASNGEVEVKIGEWKDVYCNKNRVYYEAQIIKIIDPANTTTDNRRSGTNGQSMESNKKSFNKSNPTVRRFLFHFKGWSSNYDEWIDADSDRIAVHNLYTNPMSSNPKEQERWQGAVNLLSTNSKCSKEKKGVKNKSKYTHSKVNRKSTGGIVGKSKMKHFCKEIYSKGKIRREAIDIENSSHTANLSLFYE